MKSIHSSIPALATLVCTLGCAGSASHPDAADAIESGDPGAGPDVQGPGWPAYGVPLAPDSPWPKFRRDAAQTGATPLKLTDDGAKPWKFPTGKGIFSSPIVGGDGTVYIGSADRSFYAIRADGTEKWRFRTGEIIDSAGLLDDRGRVFFGSGDGHVYALDAATGTERWRFLADDPAERGAFIRWFEGNLTLGPDGTLYAGCDNFWFYALDRETGQRLWRVEMPDQTWSAAAVDAATGRIFVGNNHLAELLGNTFAFDATGGTLWSGSSRGSIAASPLLLAGRGVVVGGFDGSVRAHAFDDGKVLWQADTRDHLYASPALLPSGDLVQASTDGTVYAIDPATGTIRWAFDWGAPIRSSPAVDGDGHLYAGTGDGHLLVLEPDGRLRWAIRLIHDDRDDMNASPALGRHAVHVAGESGEVFQVPYDFCLRAAESANPDCLRGPAEPLPAALVDLRFTTRFGTPLAVPPAVLAVNEALAFSLVVRAGGNTRLALISEDGLTVAMDPPGQSIHWQVSGNRQFLVVTPDAPLTPPAGAKQSIRISGTYLVDPDRSGLKFTGGKPGGTFDRTFTFAPAVDVAVPPLLAVPSRAGEPSGVLEMYRIAAPLPSMLPSYNQIGFDSLHYLIGMVEGSADHAVAWVVEGRPDDDGTTVPIPDTRGLFALEVSYLGGLLTLSNEAGFALDAMSARIGFESLRLSARLGDAPVAGWPATLVAQADCGAIPMYGEYLRVLGLCNPATDRLIAYGAALLRRSGSGVAVPPAGLGTVAWQASADRITATLAGSTLPASGHAFGILLVDPATGRPVSLDYGPRLVRKAGPGGAIAQVELPFEPGSVPAKVRAWFMVGTTPAASASLDVPSF
jgi:outer membrane protein assembly factor BamB